MITGPPLPVGYGVSHKRLRETLHFRARPNCAGEQALNDRYVQLISCASTLLYLLVTVLAVNVFEKLFFGEPRPKCAGEEVQVISCASILGLVS